VSLEGQKKRQSDRQLLHGAKGGHGVLAAAAEAALHAVEILDHRLEVEHGRGM
jgi:hypothetical protein